MMGKIREVKEGIEILALLAFGNVILKLDKFRKDYGYLRTLVRHPVVVYIARMEERALRNLDPFERMDLEVARERDSYRLM